MQRKHILILTIYLIIAGLCYFNTRDAKFLSDFYSWIGTFDEYGFKGLLKGFDYQGLQYVNQFLFFSSYKIFGLHHLPWFLLFIFLHAGNALLISIFLRKLLVLSNYPGSGLLPEVAGLLFLVSPYQTEAVVWGATIHYLVVTTLILVSLLLVLRFLSKGDIPSLFSIHLIFFISLFTLEVALVLPFAAIMLKLLSDRNGFSSVGWRNYLKWMVAPQISIMFIYFGLNYLILKNPVGHYGASTHLTFHYQEIANALIIYLLKFFTFFRYIPYDGKYSVISTLTFQVAMQAIIYLLAVLAIIKWKRAKHPGWPVAITCFLVFIVFLIPVINLETTSIRDIQSDRYGYVASAFFFMFLPVLIYTLVPPISYILICFYLVLSLVFLRQSTINWQEAGRIADGLINNFQWLNAKRIYVLNMPDNYNGVYLFRNGFREAIQKHTGVNLTSQLQIVTWYNMLEPDDSVKVNAASDTVINVEIGRGGQWFWLKGRGESYTTQDYVFQCGEVCLWFTVRFKTNCPECYIIYQSGSHWNLVQK